MAQELSAMFLGAKVMRVGARLPGAMLCQISPCVRGHADVALRLCARLPDA